MAGFKKPCLYQVCRQKNKKFHVGKQTVDKRRQKIDNEKKHFRDFPKVFFRLFFSGYFRNVFFRLPGAFGENSAIFFYRYGRKNQQGKYFRYGEA